MAPIDRSTYVRRWSGASVPCVAEDKDMSMPTGTLLVPRDIGAGWDARHTAELARSLELRLKQPVVLCDSNDSDRSVDAGIRFLVNAGAGRLVIVPLGLLPVPEQGVMAHSIARARRPWPALRIHAAAPLTWLDWSNWLRITARDALNGLAIQPAEAAMVLVGENSSLPMINANLGRLAQLVLERSDFARVSSAFVGTGRPGLRDALRDLARLGYRHVAVVPWLIREESSLEVLHANVIDSAQAHGLNAQIVVTSLAHPALINLLASNHCAALGNEPFHTTAESSQSPRAASASGPLTRLPITEISSDEAYELDRLEQKINEMLPPEYQGRYEDIRPQSMGTAALKLDSDGNVAWDQIWTSFCDLALAGGPPHRGTLLEPVTAAEVLAEPEAYQAVVAEIERGIRLTTGLPVVGSRVPGWVGVCCESEEMAIWLMRAILVENVMVRREQETLYVPAGPKFTVKREVKNVITSIAKTVHYWSAHLVARRRLRARDA